LSPTQEELSPITQNPRAKTSSHAYLHLMLSWAPVGPWIFVGKLSPTPLKLDRVWTW